MGILDESFEHTEPYLPKGYPTTKEEWWLLCKYHAQNFRYMIINYHPSYGMPDKLPISAPGAEAVCAEVRDGICKNYSDNPINVFTTLLANQNPNMASFLSGIWFSLPESMGSRELPGFHALCDLCSECHILEEQ